MPGRPSQEARYRAATACLSPPSERYGRRLGLVFRILGPLEVSSPEGPIRLGGPRQRSVLAILLLDPNRIVSIDRLAEELYGGAPPVSAVTQVHRQISELRMLLEPERSAGSAGSVVETRPPGYRVRVAPDALDLLLVERLADDAGSALASGDAEAAVPLYRQALAQWRGAPLADLAFEPFARPVIERLSELRLTIVERCLGAELELGRGAELVAELEQLVLDNPLNERLRAQLMIALYRAGRQADALERFRTGRAALVEAFGLEPTPALKELERRVLLQDPTLDAPGRRPCAGPAGRRPDRAPRGVGRRGAGPSGRRREPPRRARPPRAARDPGRAARGAARRAPSRPRAPGSDDLGREGVTCRAAAFVSRSPGVDTARLALTHEADTTVVDAPRDLARDGVVPDAIALMLERSPCDVALLTGSAPPTFEGGVSVLFGGGDHDWAAAELGAWLAAGAGVPLRLVGAGGRGAGAGDASRLLASASIAIQRLVGVEVEPVLADPGPERGGGGRGPERGGRGGALAPMAARGARSVAARARRRRHADAHRAPGRAPRRPRAARPADQVHVEPGRSRVTVSPGRGLRDRRPGAHPG